MLRLDGVLVLPDEPRDRRLRTVPADASRVLRLEEPRAGEVGVEVEVPDLNTPVERDERADRLPERPRVEVPVDSRLVVAREPRANGEVWR